MGGGDGPPTNDRFKHDVDKVPATGATKSDRSLVLVVLTIAAAADDPDVETNAVVVVDAVVVDAADDGDGDSLVVVELAAAADEFSDKNAMFGDVAVAAVNCRVVEENELP